MKRIVIELNHTREEWEASRGDDCWDFDPSELFDGTVEPDCDVYWLIEGRLCETNL